MNCSTCQGKTTVTKTIQKENLTIRYRKCTKCKKSMTTLETSIHNLSQLKTIGKQLRYISKLYQELIK